MRDGCGAMCQGGDGRDASAGAADPEALRLVLRER